MISVSILELLISNTITFIIFFVYTFRYIQHKKTQIVTKVEFFLLLFFDLFAFGFMLPPLQNRRSWQQVWKELMSELRKNTLVIEGQRHNPVLKFKPQKNGNFGPFRPFHNKTQVSFCFSNLTLKKLSNITQAESIWGSTFL